ncbi:TPA: DNA primase [Raoultella ornithinolytica]
MSMKIRGFGHLFGLGASASEDNEDEKEKSKKAKGRRAEEDKDDDQDDNDKSKKSQRAEDDDDKEKSKRAKKGRADDDDDADADEGDEDDGDDSEEDSAVKKGRRAERDRISRILGSKFAAGKGPLAISLAITTGMSSAAAIRVMASSGPAQMASQPRRVSLDERMSKVENHQLGNTDNLGAGANSVVSRATALYNQVKGKK